jgi:hypothetical protein
MIVTDEARKQKDGGCLEARLDGQTHGCPRNLGEWEFNRQLRGADAMRPFCSQPQVDSHSMQTLVVKQLICAHSLPLRPLPSNIPCLAVVSERTVDCLPLNLTLSNALLLASLQPR